MRKKHLGEQVQRKIVHSFVISEDSDFTRTAWKVSDETLKKLRNVERQQRRAQQIYGHCMLK